MTAGTWIHKVTAPRNKNKISNERTFSFIDKFCQQFSYLSSRAYDSLSIKGSLFSNEKFK